MPLLVLSKNIERNLTGAMVQNIQKQAIFKTCNSSPINNMILRENIFTRSGIGCYSNHSIRNTDCFSVLSAFKKSLTTLWPTGEFSLWKNGPINNITWLIEVGAALLNERLLLTYRKRVIRIKSVIFITIFITMVILN